MKKPLTAGQRIDRALYALGYQGTAIVRSADLEGVIADLEEQEVPYSIRHWTTGMWKIETSAEVSNG